MNKANPRETPLPIGVSLFEKVIEGKYYYVDKTLLIKDILDRNAEVNLFTRPRRFGKTLNMRMLQSFFEDTREITGKDKSALFSGLKIMQTGEKYLSEMGQYPLVLLTFKDARQMDFESAFRTLKDNISSEYKRHKYLLKSELLTSERKKYEDILNGETDKNGYFASLKFLTECLYIHHGKKAIVLLDEYDVPLEAAWSNKYYSEMIDFIRTLLGTALKDNDSLAFAVITGCLRISKESIFTGLNNLAVNSIMGTDYTEFFGFTQDEIDSMLKYYNFESRSAIIKKWYNGYIFGSTEVYNPWSSINVVKDFCSDINTNPRPYWVNTSSNSIVRTIIDRADDGAKADLDTLIAGGAIKKQIHEDVTYDEVDKNINNVWNFLFFTGYLKKVGEEIDKQNNIIAELKIPNTELAYIFQNKIREWFEESLLAKTDLSIMHTAVINGDAETFQKELSSLLMKCISFYDNQESFYHGFLTGALSGVEGYIVKSNRESGNGRSDVVMRYLNFDGKVIVFEIKVSPSMQELEKKCEEALCQIEEKQYAKEFQEEGYKTILKYGISFYKKNCMVRCKNSECATLL